MFTRIFCLFSAFQGHKAKIQHKYGCFSPCDIIFVYSANFISTSVCAICIVHCELQSALTSVGNLIDVIQVDLFGAKIIVSRANRIIKLSIASVLFKNDSKISILLMALKELLQFFFRIKWPDSCRERKRPLSFFLCAERTQTEGNRFLNET